MAFIIHNPDVLTRDPLIAMEETLDQNNGDYTLIGELLQEKVIKRLKLEYGSEFIVALPYNNFLSPYKQLLTNLILWHSIHILKKTGMATAEIVTKINSENEDTGYRVKEHPLIDKVRSVKTDTKTTTS